MMPPLSADIGNMDSGPRSGLGPVRWVHGPEDVPTTELFVSTTL
jgi:hypothetical protein